MAIRNYVDELSDAAQPEREPSIPLSDEDSAAEAAAALTVAAAEEKAAQERVSDRRGALNRRKVLRIQLWFWIAVLLGSVVFLTVSPDGRLWGPIAFGIAAVAALDRGKRVASLKRYI